MKEFEVKDYIATNIMRTRLEEAQAYVVDMGYTLRVVKVNGKPCITTRDYKIDRLNVEIMRDEVVSIEGWG